MLDGPELTWNGRDPQAKDYQLAINRMARGTLGVFRSTPLGALMAESSITPAVPLLDVDYRQSRYAQRLLRRPEGSNGAEAILIMKGSDLADRLRARTPLAEGRVRRQRRGLLKKGWSFRAASCRMPRKRKHWLAQRTGQTPRIPY
jgi:hypothetical protein